MAFSTKITFSSNNRKWSSVTFDNVNYGLVPFGRGILGIEDNLDENFKSLKFTEVAGYYYDYIAEITIDEFMKFHEIHYKPSFLDNDFKLFLSGNIQFYDWVTITVYEWESGLG